LGVLMVFYLTAKGAKILRKGRKEMNTI